MASVEVQVTDVGIIDLILSILDSPYANHLTRQFVFASITKISSRPTTSLNQQERIAAVLAGYTTNPELELQQRAVEFASLFSLGELRVGVLERMPPPELKATVTGVGMLFDHVSSDPVPTTFTTSERE
jgi:AP-1 complex subunit gamma-1